MDDENVSLQDGHIGVTPSSRATAGVDLMMELIKVRIEDRRSIRTFFLVSISYT